MRGRAALPRRTGHGFAFAYATWWTVAGLAYAWRYYVRERAGGAPISPGNALTLGLLDTWMWGAVTLIGWALARSHALVARPWPVAVGAQPAAGVVLVTLRSALLQLVAWTWVGVGGVSHRDQLAVLPAEVVFYLVLIAVGYGIASVEKRREREVAAARLASELAEARLHALQVQLQPHFLFNALNAVASLVDDEPSKARTTLARLGDLLRATLAATDTPEVPLRSELKWLDAYFDIQRERFGERLVVTVDVEPFLEEAMVPALIFQPLVENALKHGANANHDGAHVHVAVARTGSRLRIAVRDHGRGPVDGGVSDGHTGIGLRNTRRRLEALYGADHALVLQSHAGGGAEVAVELPLSSSSPVHVARG